MPKPPEMPDELWHKTETSKIEEGQAIDLSIATAFADIRKFNEQFSPLNRALDALSFDDKRDPAEVTRSGDEEAREEVQLLAHTHESLAKYGLGISLLEDGKDVLVSGGGRGAGKATSIVAYLDIVDPDKFAEYLKGLSYKNDRLALRQFHLVTLMDDLKNQIERHVADVRWAFLDNSIEKLTARPSMEELARKLGYALKESGIEKQDAVTDPGIDELVQNADNGTLVEFSLFEKKIRFSRKWLTSMDDVSVGRGDFVDLETPWRQALAVFELVAHNPKTQGLADEAYELLGEYHIATATFLKTKLPYEWATRVGGEEPAGTPPPSFNLWGAVFIQKWDELGRRIEEINAARPKGQ